MSRNEIHGLQITPLQDEAARQRFALGNKRTLNRTLRPLRRVRFDLRGQECDDESAVARLMDGDTIDALWQALNRSAQEQMWAAVAEPLGRCESQLRQRCQELAKNRTAGGTLSLSPDCKLPDYLRIPIHLQPGGYGLNRDDADILAGALYEAGGAIYSAGQGIGIGQSKAEIVQQWLQKRFPNFSPRRILDIGTSAGSSATPYARLFPHAEVHAIDVAPSLLRYAHARAEALGAAVHFHQMSADNIRFGDASFDLIVSHNLLHEIPVSTARSMYAECHRLLRPGGLAVHQDVPLRFNELDAFGRWDYSWDLQHNNEPFWLDFAATEQRPLLAAAGFDAAQIFEKTLLQADGSMHWYLVGAARN